MPEELAPPTTVKEIGIHIGYMRGDIQSLKYSVEEAAKNYATKEDVAELKTNHDSRITKLETKQTLKTTILWVGLVASAIINIVVIYQLFTGGKS